MEVPVCGLAVSHGCGCPLSERYAALLRLFETARPIAAFDWDEEEVEGMAFAKAYVAVEGLLSHD